MKKFQNTEEIRDAFIESGWSRETSFRELSLQEAKEKGHLFAITGMGKGRKYYVMEQSGNIFSDDGKIALFHIKTGGKNHENEGY